MTNETYDSVRKGLAAARETAERFADSDEVFLRAYGRSAVDELDYQIGQLNGFDAGNPFDFDAWLLRHAADGFDRAYRRLADSINSGFSHAVAVVETQAHARAIRDVASTLIQIRHYGPGVNDISRQVRP